MDERSDLSILHPAQQQQRHDHHNNPDRRHDQRVPPFASPLPAENVLQHKSRRRDGNERQVQDMPIVELNGRIAAEVTE